MGSMLAKMCFNGVYAHSNLFTNQSLGQLRENLSRVKIIQVSRYVNEYLRACPVRKSGANNMLRFSFMVRDFSCVLCFPSFALTSIATS